MTALNYELTKQHFHVRIYRSYLKYLSDRYPDVDARQLCENAGLPFDYLQSTDGWVSIEFNSRFMAEIRKHVNESDFQYQAGEVSFSPHIMGPAYYAMKLMPLEELYANIWRLTSQFNKVVRFEARKVGLGKIEIRIFAQPEELNKTERQVLIDSMNDIVRNSMGFYAGFAKEKNIDDVRSHVTKVSELDFTLTLSYPIADRRAVRGLLYPSIAASAAFLIDRWMMGDSAFTSSALAGFCFLAVYLYFSHKSTQDLRSALNESEQARSHVDTQYRMLVDAKISLQRRLSEAEAINQLTSALSDTSSEDEILQKATEALTSVLSFDRVVLMLANLEIQTLEVRGYSILDPHITQDVRLFKLPIDIESTDPSKVSNIYRFGHPVLIADVAAHINSLNTESRALLQASKSKSFVAVPIRSAEKAHGVLLADTFYSQRELTTEDRDILTLAGQQIAMALEKQHAQADAVEAFVELEMMAKSYSRFVPFQVIELLGYKKVTDIEARAGKEISMSVLFCDIRGFTSMSEVMSPADAIAFLNSYFSHLAPTIQNNNGIIDKFMGDGIMALFMDPKDALRAASEFQHALRKFNDVHRSGGKRELIRTGMGIHFGRVILGAVGYEDRLSISVVSDSVNLASRLDGLTKKFGVDIVCSEEAFAYGEDEHFRIIGHLSVDGRQGLNRVYEYFGHLSIAEKHKRNASKELLAQIVEMPENAEPIPVPPRLLEDSVFRYYADKGRIFASTAPEIIPKAS